MPYLWSNPEDDKLTSANAPMPQLHSADIGSIVAAIMRSREEANQNSRQDYQAMLSGIGKGVSGGINAYAQNQEQGQLASYMDAARNPQQDELGGQYASFSGSQPTTDQIYSSMSPGTQLQAQKWQQGYDHQHQQDELKRAMDELRMQNIESQITSRGQRHGSGGTADNTDMSDDAIRRSEFPDTGGSPTWTDDQGREWRTGPGGRAIPVKSTSGRDSGSITPYQQMELDRRVNQLMDLSKKEEAANKAALKPRVHFSKENELNTLTGYQGKRDQVQTAPGYGVPPAPPKAGDVVKGYRFTGGDPADKNNWEKVE